MTESVSGFGPRPADDYVRGGQVAQKRDTSPALKVGPGSAGPTPAPQPVPKDPRSQAAQNEANKAFDVALKAAQQAQKNFNTANGTYNVAAANFLHMEESNPGRNKALTDVSQKVDKVKQAAEAQFEACKQARDAALKTGDPKKIQAAEEAYDKAKIQLNTAERVIKIVRDEVDKLTNAVLARMGISRTSQGDPQQIQKSNQGDETTKYLHKNAKEKERQLFAAFDELDKAVQHLNEVKNRAKATNNLDELNNAKDQVRSAAEALVTAANDNLEAWDQAHGAAIPDPRANEAVVVIIKQHGQDALMLKGAALQVSNDALAQLQ
jgi:hypothetical protein